jgi:hypothetical protein
MATIAVYGISDLLIDKFGERVLPFASFLFGLLGFPLMEKLSTIDGALDLYKQFKGSNNSKPPPPTNITINIDQDKMIIGEKKDGKNDENC